MTRPIRLSVSAAAAIATVTVVHTLAQQGTPRLRLEFEDYAQLPITGQLDGQNTMGQLRIERYHVE